MSGQLGSLVPGLADTMMTVVLIAAIVVAAVALAEIRPLR
jgi:hypothetical protein